MDARLRADNLTVPQYATRELLAQRPGLSNADLARGVLVSRPATHQLLAGLKEANLALRESLDGMARVLAELN